jgi:hypothetical protein
MGHLYHGYVSHNQMVNSFDVLYFADYALVNPQLANETSLKITMF